MNILIVKTSALGDIIQVFPVLHYLHRNYPQAKIDWVVERPFMDLVNAHPYVHQTIPIETKKWRKNLFKKETRQEIAALYQTLRQRRYQLVFDLQGNIKSGLLAALTCSPRRIGFGYQTVKEGTNVFFTNQRYNPPAGKNIREDYLFIAQSALGDFRQDISDVQLTISTAERQGVDALVSQARFKDRLKILVCPGSTWANKQLAKETLMQFLTRLYHELGASFLFAWGSPEEKKVAEELAGYFPEQGVVLERFSLPVLQNLMSRLDLVVAMDSLPLHLAGTTLTPTYSVFGASSSDKYKPIGAQHQAFQGTCPYQKRFEKRCSLLRRCSTGACVKEIEGDFLYAHFIEWWTSRRV